MKRTRSITLTAFAFCTVAFLCRGAQTPIIYAQALVDSVAGKHPELNILSIHAVPEGGSGSQIIASSNHSKVGKKSDPDDLEAQKDPKAELRDDKKIVDIGLPLQDSEGHVIGTMVTEVKYSYTKDPAVALKHATEVRDEMKKELNSAHLMNAPYFPAIGHPTYAQQVLDEVKAKHPELNTLSFHVIPAGETESRIIASNQANKMGRRDDPDDLDAMKEPQVVVMPERNIVDIGIALKDSSGKVIGTIVSQVKFSYTNDKDKALKLVEDVRDQEISPKVESIEQLIAAPR